MANIINEAQIAVLFGATCGANIDTADTSTPFLCLCLRLLGPSAAADILQLSSSLPLQSRGRARLLVGNEDVHIIARSDDELLDDFFHEQSSTGGQAGEYPTDALLYINTYICTC